MQARRDEAKHMEAQTLSVLGQHQHALGQLGLGQHQHAVQVRRGAPPELLRSSGAVPLPLLFRSPLLRATARFIY